MYDMNDLNKFGWFRQFGQFKQFKVNLGSGINFAFVTLNFSNQKFYRALLMRTVFWRRFWRKSGFWQHLWNRCSHAISMGELPLVYSDLSQFLWERLYFTESVNLNGILVWSLNTNGNWAKFFLSRKFSENLAGNSPKCGIWEILYNF